jgi:hypothetical protein
MGIFARRQRCRDVCGLGLCGYCGGLLLTLRWRQADSNHRSREGGDRRLGGLICCSREFPRCRLFRLSGAEVLRRNSGRIGGFEKESSSATARENKSRHGRGEN